MLGPKMYFDELGALRPVFVPKGDRSVRLRPSGPTAMSLSRSSPMVERNCRNGSISGKTSAMVRKVLASSDGAPEGRTGQSQPRCSARATNFAVLKVVPSYTPIRCQPQR